MAEEPQIDRNTEEEWDEEEDESPSTPFDHPAFLPVLLTGFVVWFGYDGFLTSDPDMLEHQTFNRVMFAIMLPICVWMVPRGIREFRAEQAAAADKHSGSKPS